MPTLENLTENDILQIVNDKSYRRARGYLQAIRHPVRSDKTLRAEVQGSSLYHVEIDVDEGGIHAICSCPYTWGSYCKHIGGVLLKWLQAPTTFETHEAPTTSMLHGLEVIPVTSPPTQRPDTPPDWMQLPFEDRWEAERLEVVEWLNEYKLPTLRGLAKNRNWRIKSARKDDVIQQLIDKMSNLGDNAKAIYGLDENHRNILRATALLSGRRSPAASDLERLIAYFDPTPKPAQTEIDTGPLVDAGLAVRDEISHSYLPSSDFVPYYLACHFPPLLETVIPAMSNLDSDHSARSVQLADATPFLQALHQLMLLFEQSATPLQAPMPRPRLETFYDDFKVWDYDPAELLAIQKNQELQQPDVTTLTVPPPAYLLPDAEIERFVPVAGDAVRLEFIHALLVATGIVQPGSPVTLWREVKEAFLLRDDATQRAILARTYFDMTNWNELWTVLRNESTLEFRRTLNHGSFIPDQATFELAEFRHLVMRILAYLPDNKWVVLDELRPLLRAAWPHFYQMTEDTWYDKYYSDSDEAYYRDWFLARQGAPLDPDSEADWNLAQWNFICQMLTGPLHWLGLADLCVHNGSPTAVRLRGLADLYWDRIEAVPLSGGKDTPSTTRASNPGTVPSEQSENVPISIEGNCIHVAPASVDVHAHNLLDQIATLEVATAHQFTYQLDVQSTHATFESGVALADLVSAWSERFQSPMPKIIQNQLATWWETYGQVRVYENVTIFEFGDDYALAEMKAATSLESMLIAEISPRLILVPKKSVATLVEELEKAGYTPKQA